MKLLQYGFELEFTPADIKRFLMRPEITPTAELAEGWDTLTREERLAKVVALLKAGTFGDRTQMLTLTIGAKKWILFRDDTENLEIASTVYDQKEEMEKDLHAILATVGAGSMQAMVSLPSADFFEGGLTRVEELIGWFQFIHQQDLFDRLERNARLAELQPETTIGLFLYHPFLGPMTLQRHRILKKTLAQNSQGLGFEKEELALVKYREHSFKFVGSTIYRPDLAGPARICLEIRDVHKDATLLLERVKRIEETFLGSLSPYRKFAAMAPFDSKTAFEMLAPTVQEKIRATYPARIPAIIANLEKATFAHETFRNFAWPNHPWEEWASVLNLSEKKVVFAREKWRAELAAWGEDSLAKNRQALGRITHQFFVEAGLIKAFGAFSA